MPSLQIVSELRFADFIHFSVNSWFSRCTLKSSSTPKLISFLENDTLF